MRTLATDKIEVPEKAYIAQVIFYTANGGFLTYADCTIVDKGKEEDDGELQN